MEVVIGELDERDRTPAVPENIGLRFGARVHVQNGKAVVGFKLFRQRGRRPVGIAGVGCPVFTYGPPASAVVHVLITAQDGEQFPVERPGVDRDDLPCVHRPVAEPSRRVLPDVEPCGRAVGGVH